MNEGNENQEYKVIHSLRDLPFHYRFVINIIIIIVGVSVGLLLTRLFW